MKKSLVSLLLSFVLLCGLFAAVGCGNKENYNPDNFLTAEEAAALGTPNRIVREEITLDVFVMKSAMNPKFSTMKMFTCLSEETGLKFNFIEADTSAYSTIRNGLWENAKDLPDLFLFNNHIGEQIQYGALGAIAAFNDDSYTVNGLKVGNLIDNYMPTYKKLLSENFGIQTDTVASEVATMEDGKMYSVLCVNDVARDLTFKMFLNEAWLTNLKSAYTPATSLKSLMDQFKKQNSSLSKVGEVTSYATVGDLPETAEEIQTLEQYLDILRVFKVCDPNQNGKADEIPVTSKSMDYLRNFLLAAYGYVTPGVELTASASDLVYVPTTEAYRNYLATAKKMMDEGLMDAETFSISTDSQMYRKGAEGRLGSFVSAAAYIAVGMEHESEYTTFGPLTSAAYTGTPLQWGFNNFSATGAVIPSNSMKAREVARLLDIMYGEVGTQLIAYGVEGEDWTWDDEEKTSWTFHVPEDWTGTQEEYRATITPNVGTASALYWSNDFVGKMNDTIITALNRMSERYVPYLKRPVPEALKLSIKEYATVATKSATVDPQLLTCEVEFIRGEGRDPAKDADWQKFVTDIKAYGADDLIKCYRAAYQRYLGGTQK